MQEVIRISTAMKQGEIDNLIDSKAAARLLDVSPATLKAWRLRGRGPAFVRVGRLAKYRRADIAAWIEEKRAA